MISPRNRTLSFRSLICLTLGFAAALLSSHAWAEKSLALAWNPSPDVSVTGYYLYTREENALTPTKTDIGLNTQASVSGLKEGLKYTFTVTAYNAFGLESAPSNEAVFTVPVPLQLRPPPSPTSARSVRFPAAPGRWYELQASADLQTWVTIWQTGVANTYSWVEFQDLQSPKFKSRFYRLKVH